MRREKFYPAAEYLSGAGAGGPKNRKKIERISLCRKMSHSAENQLTAPSTTLILFHKQTIP